MKAQEKHFARPPSSCNVRPSRSHCEGSLQPQPAPGWSVVQRGAPGKCVSRCENFSAPTRTRETLPGGQAAAGSVCAHNGTTAEPFKHTPGQWSAGHPLTTAAPSMTTAMYPSTPAVCCNDTALATRLQNFASTATEQTRARSGHCPMHMLS